MQMSCNNTPRIPRPQAGFARAFLLAVLVCVREQAADPPKATMATAGVREPVPGFAFYDSNGKN